MVYSEDNQRVLLSLRQAQILEALAADKDLKKQGGCVPELEEASATTDTKKTFVNHTTLVVLLLTVIQGTDYSCFPPRVRAFYAGSYSG